MTISHQSGFKEDLKLVFPLLWLLTSGQKNIRVVPQPVPESDREAQSGSKFLSSWVTWAGAHMYCCLPVMRIHHNRLENAWGFRIWFYSMLSHHFSITPSPAVTPAYMGTMQQRTGFAKLCRWYFIKWARLYHAEIHSHLNMQLSEFITTEKTYTLQLKKKKKVVTHSSLTGPTGE